MKASLRLTTCLLEASSVRVQVRTYLRLSGLRAALIRNFNVELLKEGIHRVSRPLSLCRYCGS